MLYEPAEDSFLLAEALKNLLPELLKKNKNLRFLDVGCGSGVILKVALSCGVKEENILGADINPEAIKHCSGLGFHSINSDLFSNIKEKFDVITFNPPYLPDDKLEPKDSKRETTGGRKGNEISLRFLKQAGDYLNPEGRMFLVTSSLAESIGFERHGYCAKIVAREKMFFEELWVWELARLR